MSTTQPTFSPQRQGRRHHAALRRADQDHWRCAGLEYLIGREGHVIASYKARIKPDDAWLVADIQKAIAQPRK